MLSDIPKKGKYEEIFINKIWHIFARWWGKKLKLAGHNCFKKLAGLKYARLNTIFFGAHRFLFNRDKKLKIKLIRPCHV